MRLRNASMVLWYNQKKLLLKGVFVLTRRYDFETLVNRFDTGSFKYDQMIKWNKMAREKKITPLSVADMEFKTPPAIVEALKTYVEEHILGYTGPTKEYNTSVVSWMKRRHNWDIREKSIVGTPGVVGAFYMAVSAFTKPEEGVIVLSPVYYPFYSAVEKNGRTLVKSSLKDVEGRYRIDYDDLREKARDPRNTMLLFCSPHNPVGRVWEKEELEKVAEICEENNLLVVSDEIHFDLVMPGHEHTVFASLNDWTRENTITLTAPSKTFNLAGMHTSNVIICNREYKKRFLEEMSKTAVMNLNALGYVACRAAYDESEDWLEELIEVIYENHLLVKEHMAKHHPQIKVYDLEGTYLQWLDLRSLGLSKDQLEKLLHKEALVFLDEGYFFGEEGEGYERINIACPKPVLKEALNRMTGAINSVKI